MSPFVEMAPLSGSPLASTVALTTASSGPAYHHGLCSSYYSEQGDRGRQTDGAGAVGSMATQQVHYLVVWPRLFGFLQDRILLRLAVDRELHWSLRQPRYGYCHRVVGVATLRVDELRVRKEPTLVPEDPADPEKRFSQPARIIANPVDRFFPLVDGREDRRLIHLPHLHVLQSYDALARLPEDSDYARLIRVRGLLQRRPVTEAAVRARIERLVATCRSIRDVGYLGPGHRRERIVVMERSIHPPTTTYQPEGYELFDGHHRAVAVTYLGHERVEVLMTRATKVADFDWTPEPFDERLWRKADPDSSRD